MNLNLTVKSWLAAEKHAAGETVIADKFVWDKTPPAGVNYQTHKFSICDAIEHARNSIYAAHLKEQSEDKSHIALVVGFKALPLLATLPSADIEKNQARSTTDRTILGTLNGRLIILDPKLDADQLVVTDGQFSAQVQIT